MPTFRTAPSANLTGSIRRLIASGGSNLSPLQEIQADQAAADTAQKMGLAEKARAEVEDMQRAAAMRENPATRTEFAANSAGIDMPDATRLYRAIRGERDPNPQGYEDPAGNLYGDVAVTRPENLPAGAERLFRSALAAAQASMIGTGKSDAKNITEAAGNLQGNSITEAVQSAIAAGQPDKASALNQGGKLGNQIKVFENVGNTGATFAPGSGMVNADPAAQPANALLKATLASEAAKAANDRASAEERKGGGKPPPGYAWGPLNEQGQTTLIAIPGGPANPTGNVASTGNLSGQDLLATLPKPLADQVKALAEGRMQFPAGFALKSPYWQDMISKVSQYDPNFDAVNYNARSRARADATTGTLAKNNNALNTGIGHLAQLSDAVEGLGNVGSMPFARTINKVKNVASKEYGGTGVTDFESIVNRVAPEITKIWRGAGGAEADIKRDIDSLSNANTPEQLHSAIRNIAGLMESKLEANANQYKQGMGTTQQNVEFIIPKAKQQLDLLATRAGKGGAPADRPAGPRTDGAFTNAKGWKLMRDAKGKQAYVSPDGTQVEEVQ